MSSTPIPVPAGATFGPATQQAVPVPSGATFGPANPFDVPFKSETAPSPSQPTEWDAQGNPITEWDAQGKPVIHAPQSDNPFDVPLPSELRAQQQQSQPQGFWSNAYSASGIRGLVDSAKQAFASGQQQRDQETEISQKVSQSVKNRDFGSAAELLIAHLAHVSASASDPSGGIAGQIAQHSYQAMTDAIHAAKQGNIAGKGGVIDRSIEAVPVLGPAVNSIANAGDQAYLEAQKGNYANAAGQAVGGALQTAALAGGGDALEGAEGAEGAEAATTPLSPKDAAVEQAASKSGLSGGSAATVAPEADDIQPAFQSGLKEILNKVAADNDLDPIADSTSTRDAAQNLANQFKTRSQAMFDNIQKVTSVNVTALRDRIAAITDQIDQTAITDPEKAGVLERQKLNYENQAQRAFDSARDKGLDVDQARQDWSKNIKANELSQKIRNADDGTRGNPNINPSKLTKPLQKMMDDVDGRGGSLQQLAGEDNANALVSHVEQARTAVQDIKDFVPKSATGQKAFSKIVAQNTIEKPSFIRGGKVTARTDWNGVVEDLGNLNPSDRAGLGSELQKAKQFAAQKARAATAKTVVRNAAIGSVGSVAGGALAALGYEVTK